MGEIAAGVSAFTSMQATLHALMALQMTDYRYPQPAQLEDRESFNYIIVGGGSAGCVLANRLSEDPNVKVLLIEAGGVAPIESELAGFFPYMANTHVDYNYTTVNDGYTAQTHRYKNIALTSGKMLGGSGSIDHLIYYRGIPNDFKLWAEAAKDETWNWENVTPYFKKIENLHDDEVLKSSTGESHGTQGYIHVAKQHSDIYKKYLQGFEELGHKITTDNFGNDILGYGEPLFTLYNGVRQSSANTYLPPLKDRPNFKLLLDTTVTKVIIDDNNVAVGVEAETSDGIIKTFKAIKEVVVSAGVFNSVKLLWLSGIGPQEHLNSLRIKVKSNLPVGKNMQDHISVSIIHKTIKSDTPTPPSDPHMYPLPMFIGYVSLNSTDNPQYQAIGCVFPHDTATLIPFSNVVFDFKEDICQNIADANKGYELVYTVHNLLHPESRGEVLIQSTNPHDAPLIYSRYFSNNADLENLATYVADYNKILKTEAYKAMGAELVYPNLPECTYLEKGSHEYWKCYVLGMMGTTFHYSGTCSMGKVVDSRLRVFGIKRLRVCDASVIPYITSGNINQPVYMIAEKAADMIKEDQAAYKIDEDQTADLIEEDYSVDKIEENHAANKQEESSLLNIALKL